MKRPVSASGLLATIAFVALLSAAAVAQSEATPDLSGEWTLNPAKSKIAKHSTPRDPVIGIVCRPDYIMLIEKVDGKNTTTTIDIGGKITPIAHVRGGEIVGKAYWKKSTLVIEIFGTQSGAGSNPATSSPRMPESSGPDPTTSEHTIQRLSLSADGKTLTREFGNGKEVLVYYQDHDHDDDQDHNQDDDQ
jgi:hypothetical protein